MRRVYYTLALLLVTCISTSTNAVLYYAVCCVLYVVFCLFSFVLTCAVQCPVGGLSHGAGRLQSAGAGV